jgi:hypothetical protein
MEKTWRAREKRSGQVVLEITGDAGVICELVRDGSGVWRGAWNRFEGMQVELSLASALTEEQRWDLRERTRLHDDVAALLAPPSRGSAGPFHGRGIVMTAGGESCFVNAYLSARLLRHLGCSLPIEWFYLGSADMTQEMVEIAESIPGLRCIDLPVDTGGVAATAATGGFSRERGGWQSKPAAILRSSFAEVLYLDADNFALRDPSYLFEAKEYQDHGAIFWPDIGEWDCGRFPVLSEVFQVDCSPGAEFESGQILVDKRRCELALRLAHLYNRHSDLVYKVVFGDKDTYYFAFRKTRTDYYLIPTPTMGAGGIGVLVQHDPSGKKLFCHCIESEWTIDGTPSMSKEDLPHRDVCAEFLSELAHRWKGRASLSGSARPFGGGHTNVPEALVWASQGSGDTHLLSARRRVLGRIRVHHTRRRCGGRPETN